MAEPALFSVTESLVGKLASRAYEEASRVVGVYDDLREMKDTLSFIKAVLLDAEQKQEQNHELREWLRQLKHVFSDAEDVIDEVKCEASRKHVVNTFGSTKRKVCRFFSTSNPLVFRYRMARQIQEIKARLDKVAADRNKFGLETNDVDKRVVHRREVRELTHSHVIASDVIGREDDKEAIISLLMQIHGGDDKKSLSIIPIVGIGGLGKTTLAKLVFNEKRTESYPLKMWVCVSDDFDLKQVIIKILNSATVSSSTPIQTHQENFRSLEVEVLQTRLRDTLAGQKFLLVLDDVWNEDHAKWVELRNIIQVGVEGSKILVTTRSHSIANMMGTVPSYNLEGLSEKESLSLFVNWAFKKREEEKYPGLLEIGKEIVKKCGGLPLAVRTLESLLFSKVGIEEWEFVRDNEIWNLPQKKDDILPALKLSYDQIPSYLKRCFACFSLFRKDHEFDSLEVTHLWGALGLLPSPNQGKTFDDVANQFLQELHSRSFLQDFLDFGTTFYFELHDLVHNLALYVAKDESLQLNTHSHNISENVRHLSIFEYELPSQVSIPTRLRTILFPIKGVTGDSEAFLNPLVSRCKYLRYLELTNSECENLPYSIGKLKHLRYLCLEGNKRIRRLPNSICNLQNLQVLILGGCTELQTLPKGLENLINLRYLSITTKESDIVGKEIAKLTSLQSLVMRSCDNLESLLEGIQLPCLKMLSISFCGSLKSLSLIKHVPNLESLYIEGCCKLDLSKGLDEQISELGLKLLGFYSLSQLVTLPCWLQGSANTLQSLEIQDCDNLELLPEWLLMLVHLKVLKLLHCPKLMSLPNDMHRLTSLEHLIIMDCPELCRKYQPQVGQYWPQISHIQGVFIDKPEEGEE